jgi:hypothetical protein
MRESRHTVSSWLQAIYSDNQSKLDETGRCYLKQADDIGLVICVPDEADHVHIYADLMRLPDDPDREFFEQILALNGKLQLTFGARVFLERQSNQLVALYSIEISTLDLEKFINLLANIPKVINSLRSELVDYAQDISPSVSNRQTYHNKLHL